MKKLSFMRQRKALTTAILALALVLGLAFVGCATNGGNEVGGGGSSDLDGTWYRFGDGRVYSIITARDGNFTVSYDRNDASNPTRSYRERFRGTYEKDAKSPVTITFIEENTGSQNIGDPENWEKRGNTSVATIVFTGSADYEAPDFTPNPGIGTNTGAYVNIAPSIGTGRSYKQ